jgi:hypothetical protein
MKLHYTLITFQEYYNTKINRKHYSEYSTSTSTCSEQSQVLASSFENENFTLLYCKAYNLITLLLKNLYYSNKDNNAWSEAGMGEMSSCFLRLDIHLLNIMVLTFLKAVVQ